MSTVEPFLRLDFQVAPFLQWIGEVIWDFTGHSTDLIPVPVAESCSQSEKLKPP